MTAVAVLLGVVGLVLLVASLVLLRHVRRALRRIEALLAERAAGLSAEDAAVVATLAAQQAADAVHRSALTPALMPDDQGAEADSSGRWSAPRIKASGWAAGASETMRRLRQGA